MMPELGDLRHQLERELGPVPVVVDDREHLGVDEGPHPVAHGAGLVGQQLVEQVVVGAGRLGEGRRHHVSRLVVRPAVPPALVVVGVEALAGLASQLAALDERGDGAAG